jgi:hypothetical protein
MQIHYLFLAFGINMKDDVKKERLYDMGRRLSLYGIAG